MGAVGGVQIRLVPHWERNEAGAEALILIDGKLVMLRRLDDNENGAGPSVRYVLAIDDGAIQVRLAANAHCPPGVEGCDYDGVVGRHPKRKGHDQG